MKKGDDWSEHQRQDLRRMDMTVRLFVLGVFLAGVLLGLLMAWLIVRYAL